MKLLKDAYDMFVINFAMLMMGCVYYKDSGNTGKYEQKKLI